LHCAKEICSQGIAWMRWSSEKFGVQSQAGARWMRDGSVEAKKKRLLWTLPQCN
jgi:hypothetical protein